MLPIPETLIPFAQEPCSLFGLFSPGWVQSPGDLLGLGAPGVVPRQAALRMRDAPEPPRSPQPGVGTPAASDLSSTAGNLAADTPRPRRWCIDDEWEPRIETFAGTRCIREDFLVDLILKQSPPDEEES